MFTHDTPEGRALYRRFQARAAVKLVAATAAANYVMAGGDLDSLAADHEFLLKGGVFSKDQIESYLELKQEEQDRYRMTPHPVEFDMYYSC